MKISIKFQLFAPAKSQQKKSYSKNKMWGAVNSSHAVPILVMVDMKPFEEFKSLVISAGNDHFTRVGSVITKGLKAGPQTIFWYATIPRCPSFAKKDLHNIFVAFE